MSKILDGSWYVEKWRDETNKNKCVNDFQDVETSSFLNAECARPLA